MEQALPWVSVILAAALGSGWGFKVLWAACQRTLDDRYVKKSDYQTLVDKCDRMEAAWLQLREQVDDHKKENETLHLRIDHQWERINERFVAPMEQMAKELKKHGELLAGIATHLEYLRSK